MEIPVAPSSDISYRWSTAWIQATDRKYAAKCTNQKKNIQKTDFVRYFSQNIY